jgi:hypothetical protein
MQVAITWSATRLDGGPAVVEQTALVYFARRATQVGGGALLELPA